jgi:hypothetical protein
VGGGGFLTKNWTEEIKESGAVLDSGRETSKGSIHCKVVL